MARRRSSSRQNRILTLLAGTALAGFGLSAGRDVYKVTKDSLPLMLGAMIFMGGSIYGGWNMVRGHNRTLAGTIFKTIIGNLLIILITCLCFMFLMMLANENKNNAGQAFAMTIVIQGGLVALGVLAGLIQRPWRMRRIRIEQQNQKFLEDNGFREVGGTDNILIAPDGAELKLEDERNDALVFKVIGRRSVRAKILLDDKGRMLRYVPA